MLTDTQRDALELVVVPDVPFHGLVGSNMRQAVLVSELRVVILRIRPDEPLLRFRAR